MNKKAWLRVTFVLSFCFLVSGFTLVKTNIAPVPVGSSIHPAPVEAKVPGFLNIKAFWQEFMFEYRMEKLLEDEIEMTVRRAVIERKFVRTAA